MPEGLSSDIQLEIAHVLFIDIVGYSKLLIDEQRELQQELNEIVRNTEQFRAAETAGKLVRLPTGDGMALVFFTGPETPVQCALQIGEALQNHPHLQLRMGINTGPVSGVADVNDRSNVAGAGINIAQRVMDIGDARHILLSKRAAEDLIQYRQWQAHLHELGEFEVKHGIKISVVNLYTDKAGNPQLPEKLKQLSRKQATARRFKRMLIAALLLFALALPLGTLLLLRYGSAKMPGGGAAEAILKKSIAVLPFANMSEAKENAFFADGIQDDILTSLAKIDGLRVISRTSVMGYRSDVARNLRDIGKALGVANVLEGSVRREGNRVVVNVQLIDALHDRHLWANRYDRTIADSLGLQGELATEIAKALSATLSPDEKARVETKPTENPEAYVFYLRANQIERNPDTLLEDYKTAEQLYMQAVALDPNFALAHARLASTCGGIFHFYEPLDSWKTKARSEAELALRLQPNLAEAHLAVGQCAYWIDEDYERALVEFGTAAVLAPSDGEVGQLIASIERRQGKWEESLETFDTAQKIDPQNPNIVRNLLFTNTAMRRWPEASRVAERFRAMAPASLVAKTQSGYVDFWWKGSTALLKAILGEVAAADPGGEITSCRWDVAMIDRDFGAARGVLQNTDLSELSYTNAALTPKSFLQGLIELAEGKRAQAQKLFELARPSFEKAVEEAPLSADRHANLGWFYAFAGRKDEAIREGRRAVELRPESKGSFAGALLDGS